MIDLEKSVLICDCGGIYGNLNGLFAECSRCEGLLKVKQTKQVVNYIRKKKSNSFPLMKVRNDYAIKKFWDKKISGKKS